jgi:hypothetical protein
MKPKNQTSAHLAPNDDRDIHPIRRSLRRLPRRLQHLITWLTGEALPWQQPLLPNSPSIQIAIATVTLIGGVCLGMTMGESLVTSYSTLA